MIEINPSRIPVAKWAGEPDEDGLTEIQRWRARFRAETIGRNAARYRLPARYVHHHQGRAISCPVISCTRDRTKICVITPSGDEEFIPWVR